MKTLLDEFAIAALQGICSNSDAVSNISKIAKERNVQDGNVFLAEHCYFLADCMMKARGKFKNIEESDDMTTEEKIQLLAKAILSLAENADNGWLYGNDAHEVRKLLEG